MMASNLQMRQKSLELPPVLSYEDGLPVYFLTGKEYLYQTLFCIRSLDRCSRQRFRFHLVDDGSLDIQLVQEKLPASVIVAAEEIRSNLDRMLPEKLYPAINKKRAVYPHLKKLTDIHTIPGTNLKLVLDSDMLFWKEPAELIKWLQNPSGNLFMTDSNNSYGYSRELMFQLSGYPVPELLNVGVAGLHSGQIDWKKLENWITVMEEKEGGSYYLEQALTAMIASGWHFNQLPSDNYIVYPNDKQISEGSGVLHHYVDLSKKKYFTEAWKKFI